MDKRCEDVISGILGEIFPDNVSQNEMFRTGRLEPIQINSALVSAHNRERLYWTNIKGVTQPKDKGIMLKDIVEHGVTDREKSYCIDANYHTGGNLKSYFEHGRRQLIFGGAFRGRNPNNPSDRTTGAPTQQRLEINTTGKANCLTSVSKDSLCIEVGKANLKGTDSIKRVYSVEGKSPCLNTCGGGHHEPKILIKEATKKGYIEAGVGEGVDLTFPESKTRRGRLMKDKCNCLTAANYDYGIVEKDLSWRKLTPVECERLQTIDDNFTEGVSTHQRYKMLGNGWTVDVIVHILSFIK